MFEQLAKRVDAICEKMDKGMPATRVVSLSGRVLEDLHQLEKALFDPSPDWVTSLGEQLGGVARRLLVKRAEPRSAASVEPAASPPRIP